MIKRGLKLWSTNTETYYSEALKLYRQGVFDYIELYVIPGSLTNVEKWKNLKLPFIIHNPHSMQGFNLACREFAQRNREIYTEVKIFADVLNAEYIIFHGGMDGDINETAKQLRAFNEPRAVIENKPGIALPNKFGYEKCRGATYEELQFVKSETGCGFCLDFGHAVCAANSFHQEPYAYIGNLMKLKPNMFHLTDVDDMSSEFDAHPHLGQGKLDFKKIMTFIPDEVPVTFETNKQSKDNLNDFAEDMAFLKRLIERKKR